MKLGLKIILPILLLLVIITGTFGYILYNLKQQEAVIFTEEARIRRLNGLNEGLSRQQDITTYNILSYSFNRDASMLLATFQAELDKSETLDEMFPFITTSRGKELVNIYINSRKEVESLRNELVKAIDEGDKEQINLSYNRWNIQTQNIKAALSDFGAYNINSLEKTFAIFIDIRNQITQLLIILGSLLIVAVLCLYFYLKIAITTPIVKLAQFADEISRRNFTTTTTTTTTTTRNDELGMLSRAFNAMAVKLKESYAILEQKVEERTVQLREKIKTIEDTKTAIINIMEDLEDSKKQLVKFQLAVDNASENIIITDSEGIVIYANKSIEKITGYTPEEAMGKKSGTLWKLPMPQDYYQKMWNIIKVQKKDFVGEIQNKRKSGEIYTAAISISPILDKNDGVEFFVSIERDITKEKEIDKAKNEFVSLASHQLRTPLGITKWYLEAWKNDDHFKKSSKTIQGYFDQIYRGNERVLSLVRDLLSVSRIEQGRVKNVTSLTDLTQVIKDVVEQMRILASKKGVILRLTIQDSKIPSINIDALRFHEVIENLITNAIEYTTAPGSVNVNVEKQAGSLLISIKDTGIGIPANDQKWLFTKFFRSEKAVKHNPEGSGLGLYLVKSYVEGWGGKISIKSLEGKGSTFTINLPITLKK